MDEANRSLEESRHTVQWGGGQDSGGLQWQEMKAGKGGFQGNHSHPAPSTPGTLSTELGLQSTTWPEHKIW